MKQPCRNNPDTQLVPKYFGKGVACSSDPDSYRDGTSYLTLVLKYKIINT